MPGPAVIAARDGAGRVEAARLGLRVGEATRAVPAESAPARSAPFGAGAVRLAGLELSARVDPGREAGELAVSLRNAASRPVHLGAVVLGLRWRPPAAASLRFLQNGWQSWSFTGSRPLDAAGEAPFPSGPWLRGLHHAVGVRPEDRQGWHESHLLTVVGGSPAGGVALEVELVVDARLAPGETRELEPIRVALGDDPSALLEAAAQAHGRRAGARAASPFVSGWCSWYHFFHEVREADVLRNLEALAAARDELPVEVVQIDDGYQRAVGDWLETSPRFPRGLAPLAREIRAAGFRPGLWTAPFCAVAGSGVAREHPGWLLGGGDGPLRALLHPVWAADGAVHALDASRPEVTAHLEALFRALVEMGFSYFKLDFLYAAALRGSAADPGLGRAERLRRGLEAIRAGAGEEAYLLGCGCPLGPAVGVVDGMRIGPDVAPAWLPDPATAVPGIEQTQPATRSALRSIGARAFMHRRLWQNDPDCLLVRDDSRLSRDEARSLAAAIAVSGGACILSDDLPGLSRERRALARDTLAEARRVDGLGLPGRVRAEDLLAAEPATTLVAASAEGGTLAVWNAGEGEREASVDPAALGLSPLAGGPEALLDTGGARPLPDGCLGLRLAPHASALLRLRREVPLAVFCDFDGTFSVQDVGATLAQRHAGERRPAVWARYERGEITAWQYNLEILDGLALPRSEVDRFLRSVDLDPGARELVAWCERRGVAFRVLSDGFDANLNRLQQIHGVRFAYEANQLRYEDGRWRLRAGHPNPVCPCGTGTCKRGRIEAFRAARPGVPTVHIGNGRVSDLCGALAADTVFAKDSLALELESRGVAFERFETLRDVIPGLERLIG